MHTKTLTISPKQIEILKRELVNLRLGLNTLRLEWREIKWMSLYNYLQGEYEGMFSLSIAADELTFYDAKALVEAFVKRFFTSNLSLIDTVYKERASLNDLFYYIVLTNDSLDNRLNISSFLDVYDSFVSPSKPTVFFQFVPMRLKAHFHNNEQKYLRF